MKLLELPPRIPGAKGLSQIPNQVQMCSNTNAIDLILKYKSSVATYAENVWDNYDRINICIY